MTHGGNHILWHLVESLRLSNNKAKNIETVYATMCLLLVELLTEESSVEFATFILNLQVRLWLSVCPQFSFLMTKNEKLSINIFQDREACPICIKNKM